MGNDDAYLAAYTAAIEEQDRQDAEMFSGGQGGEDVAQGFVAVGQADVAAETQDDDSRLAQKTVGGLFVVSGLLNVQMLGRGGCLTRSECRRCCC